MTGRDPAVDRPDPDPGDGDRAAGRGMPDGRQTALALCAAALLALGAGAAGRIYHGPLFALLVAGAAVGSVGAGWLLARRPPWLVAPVSVLAMLAYLGGCVWWSARAAGVPGGFGRHFVDALHDSGQALATALIPVEAQPDTVLLPVLLVWVAGLITAELAVRAGRVAAALVPPILVYLGGLALAGPHGGVRAWRALAFVVVAGVALAVASPRVPPAASGGSGLPVRSGRPLRRALRVRAVAGLGGFAVLAALLVPAVAAALPYRPADPRGQVDPPDQDVLDVDPLARISGWAQNPDQPLFDVTLSASAHIALAVLTNFDGVTWTVGGRYRDAGQALPPPAPPPGSVRRPPVDQVRQEITVRELSGRLVPAVVAPREVTGIRVAYDTTSGTLLRTEGLHPGTRYTVLSQVARPDPDLLPAARVPTGPDVARYLAAGNVPDDVAELAQSISRGNAGPYQRAYALQQFLATHYRYTADAPSGHAYPNLRFFLLAPTRQGGQRGTSEQFAAAYAALGRIMGLPTRVVVGFVAPAGTSTVRGRDALAWPEVLFDGIGWVRFDPLPDDDTPHRPLDADYHPSPRPTPSTSPSTAKPHLPSTSPRAHPSASAAPGRAGGAPPWTPWAVGGTLLGLLLAGQLTVVAARLVRVRRHGTGPPDARVRGAWQEVLDALLLAGRPAPAHLTVTETAGWAARPAGRRPLPAIEELAGLVNMVGFAVEWADETDARRAVAASVAYRRALRRSARWWRRLVWWLRPGPLRR